MIIGVPKESFAGERRVALDPQATAQLVKAGFEVLVEPGAGQAAGASDQAYRDKGAGIAEDRNDLFAKATLIVQVRAAGADPEGAADVTPRLTTHHAVIASCDPLGEPQALKPYAESGARLFSLEMMPRITRAQSMDILSSMATIAGYKAVLMGADHLPKMFPMLMTAAGTLAAARVFIVGAGVAGLQAIATARRLGGIVEAYDVRPAVKEQVESLGAKFVEMELEAGESEDAGGYAKALGEDFYRRQRELMATVVAASDVVITTAAIPGKKSPVLITAEMVDAMAPGSVIVDLAAERGGNCELTRAGEVVHHGGVTILGPLNLPSEIPTHASQMFARNVVTFIKHLAPEGELTLDLEDEITAGTLITNEGSIVHPRILELLESESGA
jgi:NAD(P) transhydrogenase subunit alpha